MAGLIYSRWRPDRGGYDYFQSSEVVNINDDLPHPALPPATKIGVPSIEAGRPIPAGATFIGSGEEAQGVIAPVDASRIVRRKRSLGDVAPRTENIGLSVLALGAAAAIVFMLGRSR